MIPIRVYGTVNASEASVTVNGIPAEVFDRSFVADEVPLMPGENILVARAVDASGNVAEERVTVRFEEAPRSFGQILRGSSQATTRSLRQLAKEYRLLACLRQTTTNRVNL